jgi:hypothetical protein
MGDSERDINNKQGNSVDSEDHNGNANKPHEFENSDEEQSENEEISELKTHENTESSSEQKTENSVEKENKSDSSNELGNNDDNTYHSPVKLEHNLIKKIKINRDKITKGSALIIGVLLILYGLILVSGSVTNVASNVIFGEDATVDAFLMLLGVLIIVAAFAQSIMDKTSLSKISSELEINEKSSESDDNSNEVKNDNKINDDNKDNILGENKR